MRIHHTLALPVNAHVHNIITYPDQHAVSYPSFYEITIPLFIRYYYYYYQYLRRITKILAQLDQHNAVHQKNSTVLLLQMFVIVLELQQLVNATAVLVSCYSRNQM